MIPIKDETVIERIKDKLMEYYLEMMTTLAVLGIVVNIYAWGKVFKS